MDVIQLIAERKIREAMENGEFDHLPNSGQPLDYDEDANLSDELRLYFRIVRNMKFATQEASLVRRVNDLRKKLKAEAFATKEEEAEARKLLTAQVRLLGERLKKARP